MRHSSLSCLAAGLLCLGMLACSTGSSGSQDGGQGTTTYVLMVHSTSPASGVGITLSPADNDGATSGNTSFVRTYNAGTNVTLTAPKTSGANVFYSWNGCNSSAGVTCTVALMANTTVTANYATAPPVTYALTVNSTNPASGVPIAVSPGDSGGRLSGTTSFTLNYNAGTAVTLTAPPSAGGSTFASWTGCNTVNSNVCLVTANADTAVTANYAPPTPLTNYTLTVNSTNPATGVPVTATPADNNGVESGDTALDLTYPRGTHVALTAPISAGSSTLTSWTGCATISAATCNVALTANTVVTAVYTANGVAVAPSSPTVLIGSSQQFTATVTGIGSSSGAVTWSVTAPGGFAGSAGTISSTGLYTTPYPAPPNVTVTATSSADATQSGSVTVSLAAPSLAAGPALRVNVAAPAGSISPLIYGMNGYALDIPSATSANPSLIRFGGDNTSRYNYLSNTTNSAADYFFENSTGAGQFPVGAGKSGSFNDLIDAAGALGAQVAGNAPVIGWITNSDTSASACSFQKATYPNQQTYDGICGNGTNLGGTQLAGDATVAALTSMPEPPPEPPAPGASVGASWVGTWVADVVTRYGPGNPATGIGKGVAHWDLDNEPEYWSGVHRDVHPLPSTYDELVGGGIGIALAIKTSDPTALVSGPVVSSWYNYFYSQKDVVSGYPAGPCYKPWSNPVDRMAHGGVPFLEYYLQQMKAAETTYGERLLDYVDVHAYFSATGTGLAGAGDTAAQTARLNSTRVLWDPTYTDPAYTQPNYATDANYTSDCNPPAQAPALIPMLQGWVAKDYPGTKTSIDEYNFGGLEAINGAVAEADVLGLFGKYGLDKGALWPTASYAQQVPGNMAFAIYRNYDGHNSAFGDTVLPSTSVDQGALSVYGAQRSSDGAVTVVVVNKTYGDLTSSLSLPGLSATGAAQVFLYSNANLQSIVAGKAIAIIRPASGSTTSLVSTTFPAQSVTLLVIPTR